MTRQTAIREVVAMFDSRKAVEYAIEDLQSEGFDRSQISLLASCGTVAEEVRHPVTDVRDLADDPDAPRSQPLDRTDVGNLAGVAVGAPAALAGLAAAGAIALSGGAIAGIAVAALAAAGGVGALGALLAKGYNDHVVADFEAQIARGGILLWVSLREPAQEATARAVLARHAVGEIQAHDIAA